VILWDVFAVHDAALLAGDNYMYLFLSVEDIKLNYGPTKEFAVNVKQRMRCVCFVSGCHVVSSNGRVFMV